MEPRLVVLGTAGDVFTMAKQIFASGGLVLQHGETTLHIDPGPGALLALKRNQINVREVTAVIATGASVLHTNDVPALIDGMTYGGFDKRGILIQEKSATFPELDKLERVIYLSPFEGVTEVEVNDVGIKALPCYNSPSIGLRITTKECMVVYSGDTSYHDDLPELYKDADFLILQMPSVDPVDYHLSREEVMRLLEAVKPRLALITGFGIKMLQRDVLNDIREIQKATGVQTVACRDNLVINLVEYLARPARH